MWEVWYQTLGYMKKLTSKEKWNFVNITNFLVFFDWLNFSYTQVFGIKKLSKPSFVIKLFNINPQKLQSIPIIPNNKKLTLMSSKAKKHQK
jgi:hypothetical protein